jgi:hypothetical protein
LISAPSAISTIFGDFQAMVLPPNDKESSGFHYVAASIQLSKAIKFLLVTVPPDREDARTRDTPSDLASYLNDFRPPRKLIFSIGLIEKLIEKGARRRGVRGRRRDKLFYITICRALAIKRTRV